MACSEDRLLDCEQSLFCSIIRAERSANSESERARFQTARSLTDYVNESFIFFVTVTVSFFRREGVSSFDVFAILLKTGERACCIYRFSSSISLRTSDHIPTNDLSGERRGGKTARERYDPQRNKRLFIAYSLIVC